MPNTKHAPWPRHPDAPGITHGTTPCQRANGRCARGRQPRHVNRPANQHQRSARGEWHGQGEPQESVRARPPRSGEPTSQPPNGSTRRAAPGPDSEATLPEVDSPGRGSEATRPEVDTPGVTKGNRPARHATALQQLTRADHAPQLARESTPPAAVRGQGRSESTAERTTPAGTGPIPIDHAFPRIARGPQPTQGVDSPTSNAANDVSATQRSVRRTRIGQHGHQTANGPHAQRGQSLRRVDRRADDTPGNWPRCPPDHGRSPAASPTTPPTNGRLARELCRCQPTLPPIVAVHQGQPPAATPAKR